jgi:hypothetical protein
LPPKKIHKLPLDKSLKSWYSIDIRENTMRFQMELQPTEVKTILTALRHLKEDVDDGMSIFVPEEAD